MTRQQNDDGSEIQVITRDGKILLSTWDKWGDNTRAELTPGDGAKLCEALSQAVQEVATADL